MYWRLARLLWVGLAAGMMLWLMRELRIHPIGRTMRGRRRHVEPISKRNLDEPVAGGRGGHALRALLAVHLAVRAGSEFAVVGLGSCRRRLCTDGLRLQEHFRGTGSAQVLLRIAPDGVDSARRVAAAQAARRRSWV